MKEQYNSLVDFDLKRFLESEPAYDKEMQPVVCAIYNEGYITAVGDGINCNHVPIWALLKKMVNTTDQYYPLKMKAKSMNIGSYYNPSFYLEEIARLEKDKYKLEELSKKYSINIDKANIEIQQQIETLNKSIKSNFFKSSF